LRGRTRLHCPHVDINITIKDDIGAVPAATSRSLTYHRYTAAILSHINIIYH
jgi:hypothetical protein